MITDKMIYDLSNDMVTASLMAWKTEAGQQLDRGDAYSPIDDAAHEATNAVCAAEEHRVFREWLDKHGLKIVKQ